MRHARIPALLACLFAAACALALAQEKSAPIVVCDFSTEKDWPQGDAMQKWFAAQSPRWRTEFGTASFFSIAGGSLHLASKRGPLARSWNPANLTKREDKVIMRITDEKFRVPAASHGRVEVTMAPVRLPGKGADLTDPKKNDACFYLLVGFDGPTHGWHGSDMPDTVAYVWADGAWRSGAEVGKDGKYDEFMRYLALGRGPDRLGELRTFTRDLATDFRLCFPERATTPMPDVVRVGVMVDSNTVSSDAEAESALRSVRFLP